MRLPAALSSSKTAWIVTVRSVTIRPQLTAPVRPIPSAEITRESFAGSENELNDPVKEASMELVVSNGIVDAVPSWLKKEALTVTEFVPALIICTLVENVVAPPSNDPTAT
jgi:hypothetical protein